MNIEIKDEILAEEPRYRIRDNNGNIIQDNVIIEQITSVTQEGTPINKALLENLYNEIMDETKQLVFDYTSEENTEEIVIEELNMTLEDGDVYDIVVSGGCNNQTSATAMQINDITDEVYKEDDLTTNATRSYIPTRIGAGGLIMMTFKHYNGNIYVNTMKISKMNALEFEVAGYMIPTGNITKMKIIATTSSSNYYLKPGFNIKIYKRR